ncbi:MAG: PilZ domain-containing protein [bacterium]
MHHERRIHRRVKCPASFRVKIEEYPEIVGQVVNLSMGGITFIFPEKLQRRAVLNFIITCPNTPFDLDIRGEIIWSRNFLEKNSFISGAVFPYLSEEEISHLRRVISVFSSEIEHDRRKKERRQVQRQVSKERRKVERRKKNKS